ncbi:transport and Golgi organization protein 2 [Haloactinospora alba]|uniref:Transport and Golgi organization protein 2 n=1 Tax=Haloactinospora alba TaxID=405555 RepID=A0A543NJ16_9ACTN|nr:NRDE family protein [Haloactinospora alba]TQN31832.1 transport and Golgi organization protein 2 [Haloactinospora alba]
MCTVIVSFAPAEEVPLLVVAVRDELLARPWEQPGRHWPERPELLGGKDTRAGGTWLAVNTSASLPSGPRVGAVVNGLPRDGADPARPAGPARPSRGELPLRLASHGQWEPRPERVGDYEPFHLLGADSRSAVHHAWDGGALTRRSLEPGVSMLVNTGIDPEDPRVRRYAGLFTENRPRPTTAELHAGEPDGIWGKWPRMVDRAMSAGARTHDGTKTDDPTSLRARVDLGDGQLWATSSVTLLACAPDVLRYAFTDSPGDPEAWRIVH